MMKNLIRFIGYDIKNGILQKWKVYLFTIIVTIVATEHAFFLIKEKGSALDYLFDIFIGNPRFYISPDATFNVPFIWFIFMIIPAFLIGNYAVNDLNAYGVHLIIKSKSKVSWWLSKTIWCISSVIIYFIIIIATLTVYAYANGRDFYGGTKVWAEYMGIYEEISGEKLILHGVLGPMLTVLSLCMLQMVLSLLVGALNAYVIIISYNVLSAYITHPIFIGNFAMFLRNKDYVSDGLNFNQGLIIQSFMIVICLLTGLMFVKRMEMFRYTRFNA